MPGFLRGRFNGLANLEELILFANDISSIEPGDFDGLTNLQTLDLRSNDLTELNFAGATFGDLYWGVPYFSVAFGFLIHGNRITSLILDDAELSQSSFDVIVAQLSRNVDFRTSSLVDVSLMNLTFTDQNPSDLSALLGIATLDRVTVDPNLYNLYADEFAAFAAIAGNTVTVIPDLLPLPGDYNNDGVVDAADYSVWRDSLGAPAGTMPNDADGGVIGQAQYYTWKANFGRTAGVLSGGNTVVPEPSTAWLMMMGPVWLRKASRRDRHHKPTGR